jgi:regulator of nucleoside diphosphate kinase
LFWGESFGTVKPQAAITGRFDRSVPVPKLPNIVISELDLKRLETMLAHQEGPAAEALQAELDRAKVLPPEKIPPSVVTMHSRVRFAMEETGEEMHKTLCYPREVDVGSDEMSVLAPLGSALLGLAVGQTIDWPVPGGHTRRVRILDVTYQPERAGEYHR